MSITSRIDAITGITPDRLRTVAPIPKSVKIEITANCNYHCSFCVKSLRADNGSMDRKLYTRLLHEMYDAGVEELGVFYIGESFTAKWLPDAIREAKTVGFPYVFLTTNGAVATPSRVKACMEAGLDSLKFSMNFYSEDQFAEIAKVDKSWWRTAINHVKGAHLVREVGKYKCGIYASSIAFDGEQGKLMEEVVAEIKPYVDEHYWLPLFSMSGASNASGMKPTAGNPGRLGKMREPLPCWSVLTEGHITHDGLLAACCFGDGLDGSMIMADLKKVSFTEGWNSKPFQELRSAHLKKDVSGTACEQCVASRI